MKAKRWSGDVVLRSMLQALLFNKTITQEKTGQRFHSNPRHHQQAFMAHSRSWLLLNSPVRVQWTPNIQLTFLVESSRLHIYSITMCQIYRVHLTQIRLYTDYSKSLNVESWKLILEVLFWILQSEHHCNTANKVQTIQPILMRKCK